jgi:hypothetical protein
VLLKRPRTAALALLPIATIVLAWLYANAGTLFAVTDAIDRGMHPGARFRPGNISAVPIVAMVACAVVIYRSIARLRDRPRVLVDHHRLIVRESRLAPYRPALEAPLQEVAGFDVRPAGFSTDVIPLGGGWDVTVNRRGGGARRLYLAIEDLESAQFAAHRLGAMVASLRPREPGSPHDP